MKLPMKKVADALDLPLSTLERWIRQGRIPIQRSGSDALFSLSALKKWVSTHNFTFSLNNDQSIEPAPEALDSLKSAMQRGEVVYELAGTDKTTILKSAVDHIDFLSTEGREELFNKLLDRERLASTGIGNGIAIPHPRDPLSRPPEASIIITYFLKTPVNFNAIDEQPVSVLFLLISPTVRHHLHLLSRLSYCIRNRLFVTFLNTHPDAVTLCTRIAECEHQLDQP
jgi:PTS system nitrogen regulatory IIA component